MNQFIEDKNKAYIYFIDLRVSALLLLTYDSSYNYDYENVKHGNCYFHMTQYLSLVF
jgi:hypothetical protein